MRAERLSQGNDRGHTMETVKCFKREGNAAYYEHRGKYIRCQHVFAAKPDLMTRRRISVEVQHFNAQQKAGRKEMLDTSSYIAAALYAFGLYSHEAAVIHVV
jgi:hypothetical protein